MKPGIDKKGYITLEAAVFLPIFILAVVSIIYYITLFSVIENVTYCSIEETARIASKAGVVKIVPGFTSVLEERIYEENPDVKNINTDTFRYLYWDGDLDNMIAVDENYNVDMELPMGFDHKVKLDTRVKCRGFTGLKPAGVPMSFDEMESEGTWEPVWIFPSSGEKYHSGMCTYVKVNAVEIVLTGSIKKKYDPCSLCDAERLPLGSFVCCFMDNGTVYHKNSCRQVDRYAVEVNKNDAKDKGYTPCSKCGGG